MGKKNTNSQNNKNLENIELTKKQAVYFDIDALTYKTDENTYFYPGALEFIGKLIKKNILIFIFPKDKDINLINEKFKNTFLLKNPTEKNKPTLPTLKPFILGTLTLNYFEKSKDAFKNYNIFILQLWSIRLLKERNILPWDSLEASCFSELFKEQALEFHGDEIITIAALSEFTRTTPLVFVGSPALYEQAWPQEIPFIIAHPEVNGEQTITRPLNLIGHHLAKTSEIKSIQFFEALNAYRLLKNYVESEQWKNETYIMHNPNYCERVARKFLFFLENGHFNHSFSGPDKELKFFTDRKNPAEYVLKLITHALYIGLILNYNRQNPHIGVNYFEKKNTEEFYVFPPPLPVITFSQPSELKQPINRNDNIIITEHREPSPSIEHSLNSSLLPPPILPPQIQLHLPFFRHEQVIYFTLDVIAKIDLSEGFIFFRGALDCIKELISKNIQVVILSPLSFELTKNLIIKLKEELSVSRILALDDAFDTTFLKHIFINNKLIVVDLDSLAAKKNNKPTNISNSFDEHSRTQNLTEIQTAFAHFLSKETQTIPFFVGPDSLAKAAIAAKIAFLIAHPYNNGDWAKTTSKLGYESSKESEQFFKGIIAYAKLEEYASDPSNIERSREATGLLLILRKGHSHPNIETLFQPKNSDIQKLFKILQLGITSRFFKENLKLGDYEWVFLKDFTNIREKTPAELVEDFKKSQEGQKFAFSNK